MAVKRGWYEALMSMESVMSYFQSELGHVASAPFSLLLILAIAYLLAWMRIRAKFRHDIADLREDAEEINTELDAERGIVAAFKSLVTDVKEQLVAATKAKVDDGIFQHGRPVGQALRVEVKEGELLIGHLVATGGFTKDAPFLYDGKLYVYESAEVETERKEDNGKTQDFRNAVCRLIV